jgi:hypothetical protein
MPKDNQLSTVLLLVALGLLIYYLTRPKSIISETFAEPDNKVVSPVSESPKSEVATPKPDVRQDLRPEAKAKTGVNPAMLRQIIAEAEKQKPKATMVESPKSEAESPKSQTPKSEIRANEMDVFQFEGNDLSYEAGASLDTAFQRPIPQQARPDTVDINKNNVKKYNAKDFLPKEINDKWFDTDFSQAKYNINDDKLINTERYVIGINTVGQSLKNASYDIRGTIPNPKFSVSPWNNSTYEPDFNLKSLC